MTEAEEPGRAEEAPLVPPGLDASLVLLRHGESVLITEGRFQGQADSGLSRLGERQAEAVAMRLADPSRHPVLPIPTRSPVEIVHSPLRRTLQTADAVARALGQSHGAPLALRPEPGLLEIGQGAWEGLHRTEIEADYGEVLAGWRRRPTEVQAPGGERLVEVAARVTPALRRVLAELVGADGPAPPGHKGASGYPSAATPDTPWSLLVGHDGVFKVTLLTLLGLPLERFWAFPFAMCGLTVVELRDGIAVLRAHNLTEHLAPLLDVPSAAVTEERQRSGAL